MEVTKNTKSQQKLETILKAAKDCFARYGYEKTTLDDIGKIAKLNKASLYYYFKNKEDIFIQVVLEEAKHFIEKLQDSASKVETAEQKIITYLIARMRYYRDVLNLHQLSLAVVQEIQPKFDAVYQSIKNEEIVFLEGILKTGMEAKLFEKHNALEVSQALIIVADALKHETTFRSNTFDITAIDYSEAEGKIEMITKLILKGLSV